jgi:acetyl esterase/lipase
MPRITLLIASLLAALLLASSVQSQNPYPPKMSGAKAHVYKKVDDVELKLYVFAPPKTENTTKRSAIVFFFGGGWRTGSPQQFERQARYLASRGMVAIAADYRVASRNRVRAVDCVRDAKSAVRWVRTHAEELGIDPDRIVASGGSAGGHLAACTAVIDEFDEPDEDTKISSRPNALVLFNPALSFDPKVTRGENRLSNLKQRMGVEPRRISPADHVDGDAPPTIILVGSKDFLLAGVEEFVERMKEAGSRCELDLYPGRSHGFFNGRGGSDDFLATTESMDRFLASLDYLSGKPTAREFFSDL